MLAKALKTGLVMAGVSSLGACAAREAIPPSHPRDIFRVAAVNPSLVTPGGELQEFALRDPAYSGWELARNDGRLHEWELPIVAPWYIVETRHTEHLRTISGRPREFTSTTTRTIRREVGH